MFNEAHKVSLCEIYCTASEDESEFSLTWNKVQLRLKSVVQLWGDDRYTSVWFQALPLVFKSDGADEFIRVMDRDQLSTRLSFHYPEINTQAFISDV